MSKTWVLDTETKGTGAHIAPLESRAREGEKELALVQLERGPRAPRADTPAPARTRFRVIDVLGAGVVGDDLEAREAVAVLANMRSALDARVYVRAGEQGRWRLLSLADTRRLWQLARERDV
jgi:hypothetical protein